MEKFKKVSTSKIKVGSISADYIEIPVNPEKTKEAMRLIELLQIAMANDLIGKDLRESFWKKIKRFFNYL